jgi:hypothetical protein
MSVAGESNFGLFLFYCWNVITSIILLNILISLFSSAYADVRPPSCAVFGRSRVTSDTDLLCSIDAHR